MSLSKSSLEVLLVNSILFLKLSSSIICIYSCFKSSSISPTNDNVIGRSETFLNSLIMCNRFRMPFFSLRCEAAHPNFKEFGRFGNTTRVYSPTSSLGIIVLFPFACRHANERLCSISFERHTILSAFFTASSRYHVSSIDHFARFISLPLKHSIYLAFICLASNEA